MEQPLESDEAVWEGRASAPPTPSSGAPALLSPPLPYPIPLQLGEVSGWSLGKRDLVVDGVPWLW